MAATQLVLVFDRESIAAFRDACRLRGTNATARVRLLIRAQMVAWGEGIEDVYDDALPTFASAPDKKRKRENGYD